MMNSSTDDASKICGFGGCRVDISVISIPPNLAF
jgi:hypothetical protein